MRSLIDGILEYSQVGQIKENIVELDLNQVVQDVIMLIAPPAGIKIEIPNPLPVVRCEKTRMQQIFQNLIGNAIKHMGQATGKITVLCRSDEHYWTFAIIDTGKGIDEKYFEKIFQLFQTLQPKDTSESSGIGLTLVKKIVELYGGKIWLESKPGAGSTFFFTYPKYIP